MTSSFPMIEILKFSVSNAFRQDHAVLNDFLNRVVKAPGVADVWHGPEVQDDSLYYVVVKWAYKNEPSTYESLSIKDALTPARKELLFVYYTHFSGVDAVPALDAPITEFVVAEAKDGVDVARFDETTKELVAQILSTLPDEAIAGGRATVESEPRKFVICLGWHSMERFNDSIRERPAPLLKAVIAAREVAEIDLKHAKLTRYSNN